MRVKKKSAEPVCMSEAELMRRSQASADEALVLIERSFDSFSSDLSELSRLASLKPKAQSDEIKARMAELDSACDTYEARVLWYVNLFVTNSESVFRIVEGKSLKRAMRLRIKAGKQRAEILGRLDELALQHKSIAQRITGYGYAGNKEVK